MRRKDKPFVLYSRGALSFTIIPRGFSGWLQLAVWVALLLPLVVWFEDHITNPLRQSSFGAAVVLFGIGVLAWFVCGLWWILAHCEVVNMSEHLRDKQRARQRAERDADSKDKGEP